MRLAATDLPPSSARWTSRIAFFSLGLILVAMVLHRAFSMPTPVAINIAAAGYVAAAVAVLLGVMAGTRIWSDGSPGTSRVVAGLIVGLGVLALPAVLWLSFERLPPINDLTTDAASPPPLQTLAKQRGIGANKAAYPGERFASAQLAAYPDLQPLLIERSSEETFEVASSAIKRLKMTIVREDPPSGSTPGALEAVDRTLILGFYDDVALRVTGDARHALIDIRSASRYGQHDFGRNAERMRRIMREIAGQLEATVPTASGERVLRTRSKIDRLVPKRPSALDPKGRSKGQDPSSKRGLAPSNAQRGPEPKGSPPSAGERRVPGRRPGQSVE